AAAKEMISHQILISVFRRAGFCESPLGFGPRRPQFRLDAAALVLRAQREDAAVEMSQSSGLSGVRRSGRIYSATFAKAEQVRPYGRTCLVQGLRVAVGLGAGGGEFGLDAAAHLRRPLG